jgi:uncharacterized protein YihD (DUF1040 family)
MRDKKRIKRILKIVEKYWNTYPDLRFTQMLINLGVAKDDFAFWSAEDDIVEEGLNLWLKKQKGGENGGMA